jgi:hypothetical protein
MVITPETMGDVEELIAICAATTLEYLKKNPKDKTYKEVFDKLVEVHKLLIEDSF